MGELAAGIRMCGLYIVLSEAVMPMPRFRLENFNPYKGIQCGAPGWDLTFRHRILLHTVYLLLRSATLDDAMVTLQCSLTLKY